MQWLLFPVAVLALNVGEHSLLQAEEECDDKKGAVSQFEMTHTEDMIEENGGMLRDAIEADGSSYVEMEGKPPLPAAAKGVARAAPRQNRHGGAIGYQRKGVALTPRAAAVAPTPRTAAAETKLPLAYRAPDWRLQRWQKKIQRFDEKDKLRFLGKGSFGTVIKAVTVCDPTSATAVKIMKSGCTTRVCFDKFVAEATSEVMAMEQFTPKELGGNALLSDRFVQIIPGEYGKGPKENTEYSFMMTLGSGDVRKQFTSKKNMDKRSMTEMIILLGDLLEGFDAMHSRGLVHRDVKPANIMVRCYGKDTYLCHPQIGDMGMTCATDAAMAAKTKIQRCPKQLAGTPLYFAPEFLKTNGQPATINDMWSVGLIMFEAVFGHLPGRMDQMPTMQKLLAYVQAYSKEITDVAVTNAKVAKQFTGRDASDAHVQAMATVMAGLLHPNPTKRMTAADGLKVIQPLLEKYRVNVLPMPHAGLPACWSDENPSDPAAAPAAAPKEVKRPGTAFPGKEREQANIKKSDDGQSEILPQVQDPLEAIEGYNVVEIKLAVGGGDLEKAAGGGEKSVEDETDDEFYAKNILMAALGSPTFGLETFQTVEGALPDELATGEFFLASVECDGNIFLPKDLIGEEDKIARLLSGMYGDVEGSELVFRFLKKQA